MNELMHLYHDYLNSPDWRNRRDKRIDIDGRKCEICGRPMDLQVHHLTYKNVGYEFMSELLTLCKYCHEKVEKQKLKPSQESFHIVNKMICRQFIKDYEDRDYSAKGDLNLCDLSVVKRYLFPYMREHGINLDYLSGTNIILHYFRNKRYEIIMKMKDQGATPDDIFRYYQFSTDMVYKAYQHPETVTKLLSEEA